jgi:DNA end-binding protein Ku
VEAPEIAPLYFDRPYYLEPAKGGDRGYALFREALRRSGKVAVASVVVKTRQHLAAVVVHDRVLVLDILRYASELRDPSKVRVPGTTLKVTDREVKMAERLVAEMTEEWDPKQYHDEYRDELLAFIKKRSRAGQTTEAPEPEEEPAPRKRAEIIDIAELLKQSLARTGEDRRRPRRRKSA